MNTNDHSTSDKTETNSKSAKSLAPFALRLVKKFSKSRRNTVRGALASYFKKGLSDEIIDKIRDNSLITDMVAAGKLLEGEGGLKEIVVRGRSQKDLWTQYNTSTKTFELELAYASGFLNSWKQYALDAIDTIRLLFTRRIRGA